MEGSRPGRIAYACSYVPPEIILAAGFDPVRLIPGGRPAEGDRLIHPATCPYVRSLLADLLEGACAGAHGIVLANSCDGMRRLSDIWGSTGGSPRPVFMDIPRKSGPDSVRYFASELERLAGSLAEDLSGAKVTGAGLEHAIREGNRLRSSMRGLFSELARPGSSLKGTDVFPLLVEREYLMVKERLSALEQVTGKGGGGDGSLRIILSGTAMNEPGVVSAIEGKHARIVAFDTCTGIRAWDLNVQEGSGNPFKSLAEAYLRKSACSRMDGIDAQIEGLVSLAGSTAAHGVIISPVKYCDCMWYSVPLLRHALREKGIPVLVLENDYGWSDLEKARIQVETFLETLG